MNEVDAIDKEILEMKSIIKDALKNIAPSTASEVSKANVTTNEVDTSNVYAKAIIEALKKVPGRNVFNCIIRINEIIAKYKNND